MKFKDMILENRNINFRYVGNDCIASITIKNNLNGDTKIMTAKGKDKNEAQKNLIEKLNQETK